MILIPGFRKCGSTSVFDWLVANDAGWGPENYKEPQYLCGAVQSDAALSWYKGLYQDAPKDRPVIDGSTLIMADPRAAVTKALQTYDDIKVVSIIRDPVKRAYSAYWHMRGKNDASEARSLEAVMSDLPAGVSGAQLFDAENTALEIAAEKNEINQDYLSKDYLRREMGPHAPDFHAPDPLWCHRYFGESCFAHLLEHLDGGIGSVQHQSFVLEELMRSHDAQESLFNFVGGQGKIGVAFEDMPASNPGLVRGRLGGLAQVKQIRLGKALLDRTPKALKTKLKSLMFQKNPRITPEEYHKMRDILAAEFEHWKSRGVSTEVLWSPVEG